MPQDKLTAVRIKQENGEYGPQIPVAAKAENVEYNEEYSVKEVLGTVDISKGPLQDQIQNLLSQFSAEEVQNWIKDNLNFTAPIVQYDSSTSYNTGDIVIYENSFYRCKQDNTQGETPSAESSYWDSLTNFAIDKSLNVAGAAADAEAAGDLRKMIIINDETFPSDETKLRFNTSNDIVNIALMDDLNTRINRPIKNSQYDNGEPGQLLRTNGDGSTEWVDTDKTLAVSDRAADAKSTGDKIIDVKNELVKVSGIYELDFINDAFVTTVAVGNAVNLTPVPNSTMSYLITDCVEGERFYISGTPFNNSNRRPYMFIDSNGSCLERSNLTSEIIDYEIVAPENAAKLVVNFQKGNSKSVWVNGEKDINKRLNVFDELKADKAFISNSIPDISCESFDYQQATIHHDNFHRTISGEKLWHIGNNGIPAVPMDYTSGFSDYETVDDGFRIMENKLRTDPSVARKYAMRIVNEVPTNPFLVEIGFTPENIGGTELCGISYNIKDANNYDSLEFVYNSTNSTVSVRKYNVGGGMMKANSGVIGDTSIVYSAYSIRVMFCNNEAHIWYDNSYAYTISIDPIIPNCKVGLSISVTSYNYHWDFFNVHNLIKPITIDSGLVNDNFDAVEVNANTRAKGNNSITQSFNGDNFEYLYNPSSEIKYFSPRSERFELRFLQEDRAGSRRSEVYFNRIRNYRLKKFKIEYDLYFPNTYLSDSLSECITQTVSTANDESQMPVEHPGYNPNVSLRTVDDQMKIIVWGQPEVNDRTHEYEETYIFGNVEREKWMHIELFVKEGYMPGHCPLTILKVNGQLVFKSTIPNAVNTVLGGYIKYGIYKAHWYNGEVGEVIDRVLYFDNVKLTI